MLCLVSKRPGLLGVLAPGCFGRLSFPGSLSLPVSSQQQFCGQEEKCCSGDVKNCECILDAGSDLLRWDPRCELVPKCADFRFSQIVFHVDNRHTNTSPEDSRAGWH